MASCAMHLDRRRKPMSTRGLLYTAAVALAVVVAYDKYGKGKV